MDFTLTPEQVDAGDLAREILAGRCSPARLQEVEKAGGDRFDPDLWRSLGDAGLIGIALPEAAGGAGQGFLELCSVLMEAGRVTAPVPLASHAVAALALASLDADFLDGAAEGSTILTVAVSEEREHAPAAPTLQALPEGSGWSLTGSKVAVPGGAVASVFLVSASTPDGAAVFVVRRDDACVAVTPQAVSDGEHRAVLSLEGVTLDADRRVGGADLVTWLDQHLTVALCAQQVGLLEGALALTSSYAKTREQFGRPIGTFQAVGQRLADAYIDVLGARLTMWQAAWRLASGLPAALETSTAKLWAADAGHRVAHTTVHVHGGVGIDLDGEAHRYFTGAKKLEFTLGSATDHARAIGRALADDPA